MPKYQRIACLLAAVLLVIAVSCTLKSPTTAGDYVYEGKKMLADLDYAGAAEQFAAAMDEDPMNAEARYLHAKSVALRDTVNILHCLKYVDMLTAMMDSGALFDDNFIVNNYDEINKIYMVNDTIKHDLKPIYEEQTHGFYDKHDITLDYFIANSIFTAFSFLDLFPHDGKIDDFQNNVLINVVDSLMNGNFSIEMVEGILEDTASLCSALVTIQENFEDSKDLVVDLLNEETEMEIEDSVLNEAFDLIDVAIDSFLLKDLGYTPTP